MNFYFNVYLLANASLLQIPTNQTNVPIITTALPLEHQATVMLPEIASKSQSENETIIATGIPEYHFNTTEEVTYDEARKLCQNAGMDLANVNTDDTHKQLQAQIELKELTETHLWTLGKLNVVRRKRPAKGCTVIYKAELWIDDCDDSEYWFVCEKIIPDTKLHSPLNVTEINVNK